MTSANPPAHALEPEALDQAAAYLASLVTREQVAEWSRKSDRLQDNYRRAVLEVLARAGVDVHAPPTAPARAVTVDAQSVSDQLTKIEQQVTALTDLLSPVRRNTDDRANRPAPLAGEAPRPT